MQRFPTFRDFFCVCLLLINGAGPAFSQSWQGDYGESEVYDPDVRTVQLYRDGIPGTPPMIYLGSSDVLTLEFDELIPLDLRESDFFVDLVPCDADWNVVQVLPIEFYDGFTQDRIQEFIRSEFTKVEYVHYRYQFPQENERFKLSGNYLLKVYRAGNSDNVVLTQRFVVVEPKVGISLSNELAGAPRRRRMERLSFTVNPGNLALFDPVRDLYVQVMPNFNWKQAIVPNRAVRTQGNQVRYDLNLVDVFPSGHEYRMLDIRSTRFLAPPIQDIVERPGVWDFFLYPDEAWDINTYGRQPDVNGQFYIEVQEWPRGDIQADYVNVYFSLARGQQLRGQQVYLQGAFTNWDLKLPYQMQWNAELRRYELDLLLKQGVYDYRYVTRPTFEENADADATVFQGRLTDTENAYYVLVYFRGPLDRNDRLLGFFSVNE